MNQDEFDKLPPESDPDVRIVMSAWDSEITHLTSLRGYVDVDQRHFMARMAVAALRKKSDSGVVSSSDP